MKKHIKFLPLMGIVFAIAFVSCNAIDDAVSAAQEATTTYLDEREKSIVENDALTISTTSGGVDGVDYDSYALENSRKEVERVAISRAIGEKEGFVFVESTKKLYEAQSGASLFAIGDTPTGEEIIIDPDDDSTFPDGVTPEDITAFKDEASSHADKSKIASLMKMHTRNTNSILFMYLFQKAIKISSDSETIDDYELTLDSAFKTEFEKKYIAASGQSALPSSIDIIGVGSFSLENFQSGATISLSDITKTDLEITDEEVLGAGYELKISAEITLNVGGNTYGGPGYQAEIYTKLGENKLDKFRGWHT